MGVCLNAQFGARPGGKGDALLEVFHLEPVFDVDGQKNGIVTHIDYVIFGRQD